MLSTLNDVISRLVDQYDPDRIILFGSHASGNANESSDIDLLIVKETRLHPVERRIGAECVLSDRRLPLDLHVYTPQELRDLFAAGSPFIEEVLDTGRLVYMRKATATWLAEVREDFETASILVDHEKYRGVCLHSQQCVEKTLKALLLEKGLRPPRTHDIVDLLHQVAAAGWQITLDTDTAVFLNSIYRGRYPTDEGLLPHGEPRVEDARRALKAAEGLFQSLTTLFPEPAAQDSSETDSTPETDNDDFISS